MLKKKPLLPPLRRTDTNTSGVLTNLQQFVVSDLDVWRQAALGFRLR